MASQEDLRIEVIKLKRKVKTLEAVVDWVYRNLKEFDNIKTEIFCAGNADLRKEVSNILKNYRRRKISFPK